MASESELIDDEEPSFIKRFFLIPCMRKSHMYGITGGLATRLGNFLFTSNGSRSFKFGIGGYLAFLWGTSGDCRYQGLKAWQSQRADFEKREGIT